MQNKQLKGYVLITGATSGIGYATLKDFHSMGYFVYFTFNRNKDKSIEIERKFPNSQSFQLDLSSNNNIKLFFKRLSKLDVHLDALVNNAAQTNFIDHTKGQELDEDEFLKLTQINLVSTYAMIYHSSKIMNINASVVNVSSVAAFNGIGSNVAYSASKAGIVNLTKSLSRQYKGVIRINAVAPGLLITSLTENFPKEYFENYKKSTSMGKLTEPEDVADVIVSLICTMKFVNGQCIIVDGGCVY
mgnify:CR=1 FL=1